MIGKDICALANFITRYHLTKKVITNMIMYGTMEYIEATGQTIKSHEFIKQVDFVLEQNPCEIRATAMYDKNTGKFTVFDIWWKGRSEDTDLAMNDFIKSNYQQLYSDAKHVGGLTHIDLS